MISFCFSVINNLIEIFFVFFVESFLVDLVPFQQNHNFEYQDHPISHYPYLHHLMHNQSHSRHHILVVYPVVPEGSSEDQHKSPFFLPVDLVKILHMLVVFVLSVYLLVVKQVGQINHQDSYLEFHPLYQYHNLELPLF